tara:strand:- start:11136 stop:11741 length:606 start_codon:yes stop_codon:yes gene_type:complete
MSIETEIAALTTSTTALLSAVTIQQTAVQVAVGEFSATTNTVNNDLNNVDNTSDANKPISLSAISEFLLYVKTSNLATVNGLDLNTGLDLVIARGQVEIPVLSYVNRATLRTPVLPVPLTGDVVNIPHLGHFQYITSFEYIDDDEIAFEAIDPVDGLDPGAPIGQWVLTTPAYEWTEVQKIFQNAVLWERWEDEELRFNTY